MSRRNGLLTAGQRESLERDGYLLVSSLLDDITLAPMRARLDELVHQTLEAWDANPGQDVEERGVVHATLGPSDPDFAPCREHRLLAEAAAAMLGPHWHLGGLELRAPLPGCGICGQGDPRKADGHDDAQHTKQGNRQPAVASWAGRRRWRQSGR